MLMHYMCSICKAIVCNIVLYMVAAVPARPGTASWAFNCFVPHVGFVGLMNKLLRRVREWCPPPPSGAGFGHLRFMPALFVDLGRCT